MYQDKRLRAGLQVLAGPVIVEIHKVICTEIDTETANTLNLKLFSEFKGVMAAGKSLNNAA
ncbi:hypothetical protein NG99_03130 [Erwinia typographi]|uniref:Uncharacterized protein n=1 Tax=Erwinia typographi TaxID=371042 RepID=A0A0A3Z9I6_9GAMM|nr:hypothetical protein NG99_03130 [Erwinia typographi]